GGDLALGGMVGGKRLGAEDLWIARLGPDGATRWFRRLDTPRHQSPWGLAAAPGGDVLVAAVRWFEADDAGDLSLLRLTPAGETRWERRFGGRYWDRPTGILAVGDGMLVVGHTSSTGSGYEDAWLLRLDAGGKL
ncbi:MAG: PQQ-binding-like beta-propeller repeat protein, partial [Pseudomonadota bacterium]